MLAVFNPAIELFSALLFQLYALTGDLGLAIIAFTILFRALLIPLTLPSLKSLQKMRDLQPELKKLKAKHKKDTKALQTAQMELYKKYNVNPLAGCLPQILQLVILLLLYQALTRFLHQSSINGVVIDPNFLWLDLSRPDQFFILPVLAATTQLLMSLMLAPAAETPDIVPNNSKNPKVKAENEKEEDMAEMAAAMQQQMLFIMPLMSGIFALRFPSGLALYWVATTIFSIIQQYYISGPGGITTYWNRAKLIVFKK